MAVARAGSTGISNLVELFHLVSAPIADIIASYEDPEGRPLFAG
ncbi:hypothetical protein ACAG24_002125 [Mycobacterium sp. pW049]